MKPKSNKPADEYVPQKFDACQTPIYGIDPIIPYIENKIVWESACGERIITRYMSKFAYVIATDLITGTNFFQHSVSGWEVQVTNPPYTLKYQWLERSYELGKPFALLLPVETFGAARGQRLFDKYGVQVLFVSPRINFKMPNKGWDCSAQFPTAWFTWNIGLPKEINYAQLDRSLGNE